MFRFICSKIRNLTKFSFFTKIKNTQYKALAIYAGRLVFQRCLSQKTPNDVQFPALHFFCRTRIKQAGRGVETAASSHRRQSTSALIYSLRGSLGFAYFAAAAGKLILDSGANKFLPTANEMRRIMRRERERMERQREKERERTRREPPKRLS